MRACYLHACLKYVTRDFLTNMSLRERFGIRQNTKATVSRYIRETVDAGMLKAFDERAGRKRVKDGFPIKAVGNDRMFFLSHQEREGSGGTDFFSWLIDGSLTALTPSVA